jgi:hypothetical protein
VKKPGFALSLGAVAAGVKDGERMAHPGNAAGTAGRSSGRGGAGAAGRRTKMEVLLVILAVAFSAWWMWGERACMRVEWDTNSNQFYCERGDGVQSDLYPTREAARAAFKAGTIRWIEGRHRGS